MTLRENLADSMAAIRRAQKKSLSEFAEELAISRSSLQDILEKATRLFQRWNWSLTSWT